MSLDPEREAAFVPHEFRLERGGEGSLVMLSVALNEADVVKVVELFGAASNTKGHRASTIASPIILKSDLENSTEDADQDLKALKSVLEQINDVSKTIIGTLDHMHLMTQNITGDIKSARVDLAKKNRGH